MNEWLITIASFYWRQDMNRALCWTIFINNQFNSHDTVKQALLSPICCWENNCLEILSYLAKVANLINDSSNLNSRLSIWKHVLLFTRTGLSKYCSALLSPTIVLANEVLLQQPGPLVHILPLGALGLEWESWVVAMEMIDQAGRQR